MTTLTLPTAVSRPGFSEAVSALPWDMLSLTDYTRLTNGAKKIAGAIDLPHAFEVAKLHTALTFKVMSRNAVARALDIRLDELDDLCLCYGLPALR